MGVGLIQNSVWVLPAIAAPHGGVWRGGRGADVLAHLVGKLVNVDLLGNGSPRPQGIVYGATVTVPRTLYAVRSFRGETGRILSVVGELDLAVTSQEAFLGSEVLLDEAVVAAPSRRGGLHQRAA